MKELVIVPYRNREVHLNCFLLYMKRFFPGLHLVVIEQADESAWNKGLLYNAAYKEFAFEYDYVILHDVDFIPHSTVDYSYCSVPTLLSTECSQFNYGHCYPTFFGGVIAMNKYYYELINGFSNKFKGWGGEDDHFYNSYIQKGVTPQKRPGNRFENFTHPRPDVRPGIGKDFNNSDYQNNLQILKQKRDFNEGLSTVNYTVIGKEVSDYIHLKIQISI